MTTPKARRPQGTTRRPKAGAIGAAGAGTTLASLSRVVGPHSLWATIFLLIAPSVSAASAAYGPSLSEYLKTEFQEMLKRRAERRTKERPIKEAKKHIKARLRDPLLSSEKKAALQKTLDALDDIDLAKILKEAGVTITSVTVESVPQNSTSQASN
jgi:hypothetical protein